MTDRSNEYNLEGVDEELLPDEKRMFPFRVVAFLIFILLSTGMYQLYYWLGQGGWVSLVVGLISIGYGTFWGLATIIDWIEYRSEAKES